MLRKLPLISQVLIPTISGFWNNAPRRRRQLAKLAFEWHVLYDMVLTILDNVDEQVGVNSISPGCVQTNDTPATARACCT